MRALSSSPSKRGPGRFLDPGHLLPRAVGRHVGRRLGPPGAVAQVGVDADDVGVPCREGKDPPAAAARDEWRTRLLDRPGEQRVLVHPVVVAVEGERPIGAEQPLDDLHGLFETIHPHPGRVIGEAGFLVVGLHPSGAQAHFEAALAQHIEGGRLLGQDERIPVVVPEDRGAHPQRGGGGRRGGQGRRRGELIAEVVRHEQSRVAEILGLACLCRPRSAPCRRAPCSVGRRSGTCGDLPWRHRAPYRVGDAGRGRLSRSRSRATRSRCSGSARARGAFRRRSGGIRRMSQGESAGTKRRWR